MGGAERDVTAVNINPLVAAIDAALTAVGVPFGDSNRPADVVADRPYVVGFFDGGRVWDKSMLSRDQVSLSAVFHSYALSPDAVRVGRAKTITAVFGLAGSIYGGWRVHLPVHTAALPIEREDKLSPPLYWQTDDFMFRLTPA